jgi:hypothetical protein
MQMDEWMDGRTDMIKLIITFCNFVNVAKKPEKGKWRRASWKTQEQV